MPASLTTARRAAVLLALTACLVVDGGSSLGAGDASRMVFFEIPWHGVDLVTTCDTVDVWSEYDIVLRVHLQFDKDGALDKSMRNVRMDGRDTYFSLYKDGSATGISFTGGPEGGLMKADYDTGKFVFTALNYKLTVPGVGMVFHQGGHYVCSVPMNPASCTQVAGPDDLFAGNFDALCRVMTP